MQCDGHAKQPSHSTLLPSLSLSPNKMSKNGGVSSVTYTSAHMHLCVEVDSARFNRVLKFYKDAFGAEEVNRIVHAKRKADQDQPPLNTVELKIGPFSFIVADHPVPTRIPHPYMPTAKTTADRRGSVVRLVANDFKAALDKARKAGAVVVGGKQEDPCGKLKMRVVLDPLGNSWVISSPLSEQVPQEDKEYVFNPKFDPNWPLPMGVPVEVPEGVPDKVPEENVKAAPMGVPVKVPEGVPDKVPEENVKAAPMFV